MKHMNTELADRGLWIQSFWAVLWYSTTMHCLYFIFLL